MVWLRLVWRFGCVPSRGRLSVHVCVLASSSHEDAGRAGSGLTPVASFHLNYVFEVSIYKTSHILRSWGLALQHMSFGAHNLAHTTVTSRPSRVTSCSIS